MNPTNKIIIIGTNHHNTLSMVRSFGEDGYNVTLFIYGQDHSYITSSIYVDSFSFFSTANEAIDAVVQTAEMEREKPVIIACSDEVSSLMDLRFEQLASICYFFNAKEMGRITRFMDKQRQLEIAEEAGFCVPKSITVFPNDVNPVLIEYPCLVKPQASIHGGKKIVICRNELELAKSLGEFDSRYQVLVQDFIRKDYEIVILGMSFDEDIIIPGFIRKYRDAKGGTTYSSVRPSSELDLKVLDSCKQIMTKINYSGLWGIECIVQGDSYYFLELNMRNDATTYAMKVAGVNLPLLFYNKCVLAEAIGDIGLVINPITAIVEFPDFNFVLKGKVGPFKWFLEFKKAKCKYFYSERDIMPFKIAKKEYCRFIRKRLCGF